MNRPIDAVIRAVLVEIPTSDRWRALRDALGWIEDSAHYTPPELQHLRWRELANALNVALPFPPQTDWQKRVAATMRGPV